MAHGPRGNKNVGRDYTGERIAALEDRVAKLEWLIINKVSKPQRTGRKKGLNPYR